MRMSSIGPPAAAAAGAGADRRRWRRLERAAGAGAQLLDAVGVGEDRQLRDEDLGRLAQRGLRVDRAVGLDVERELVEVGALADAGRLDRVGDARAPARRSSRSG